jgi:PAS domain-containing protein
MMYSRFGKPDEMVDTCVRAMDLARRSHDPWALAYAHYCMANAYSTSDNNQPGLEQFRLMQVQARLVGSRLLEGQALRGLAQLLGAQNGPGAAAGAHQASTVFREVGAPFYLAASQFAEAAQAKAHGDHAQALALLDQVAAIYTRFPNHTGMWWTLTARSAEYHALGKEGAAEQDLLQALALAETLGLPLYLSESQRLLAALEAGRGAYRKAYERSLAAADMTARANRKKVSTRVLELTERYQQEARLREIADLTRRNEQQRIELREGALRQGWLWTVLGAIGAVLAVLAFFLLRLRRSHHMLAEANGGLERSQQALRRQTGILQSVLDSMGDGVAVADAQGRLVLVNPAAERIVGITREPGGMAWPQARRFYRTDRSTGYPEYELPLARAVMSAAASDRSYALR